MPAVKVVVGRHPGIPLGGFLAVLGWLAWSCVAATAGDAPLPPEPPRDEFDFGLFASRDTTVDGDSRLRVLGPLFESRSRQDGRGFVAVRPIYSHIADADGVDYRSEVLWPLAVAKMVAGEKSWRVANVFYADFDPGNPKSRYRLWVLPFFFMGRGRGGEDYMALFPIGGTIHNILMLEKVDFVLFPLYNHQVRGRHETYSVLWPIFDITRGEDIRGWGVFPLYGHFEHPGKSERMYALWPLWTEARYDRPVGSGHGFILFPLCGYSKESDERGKSWTVLPPFFRWTRSPGNVDLNMPWPILRISSGDVTRFQIYPLYGTSSQPGRSSSFFLWPIGSTGYRETPNETVSRTAVLPIYQSETRRGRAETGEDGAVERKLVSRKVKVWPLVTYHGGGETTEVRVPDLWPVMDVPSVENNYAPFWTLYSHKRHGDRVENELLWGLFRHRETLKSESVSVFPLISWYSSSEEARKGFGWSILGGLLGYGGNANGKYVRLLFMKLGSGADEPAH